MATESKGTVLVTGGAGYIGSHTCQALAKAGWLPVAYDSLAGGHRWAVQWGPLELGDIADQQRLCEVMERHQPKAVLHFAGRIAVGESVQDPALYYDSNVAASLSLLQAMRTFGLDKIVFSSTCAIYGNPDVIPITENTPPNPLSPYGATKYMIERVLADYGVAYGLKHAVLRYFNACGASPDVSIGEAHEPETHLIPLILQVAAGQRQNIAVFGQDYPTPDGTCIRDYIHVCDLARAHVLAVERLLAGADSFTVNLGTGEGYSVSQVIEATEKVTGKSITRRLVDRRPGDPAILLSDVKKARELLPDWLPQHSSLENILRDAWNWHLKQTTSAQGHHDDGNVPRKIGVNA